MKGHISKGVKKTDLVKSICCFSTFKGLLDNQDRTSSMMHYCIAHTSQQHLPNVTDPTSPYDNQTKTALRNNPDDLVNRMPFLQQRVNLNPACPHKLLPLIQNLLTSLTRRLSHLRNIRRTH